MKSGTEHFITVQASKYLSEKISALTIIYLGVKVGLMFKIAVT